MQRLMGILGKRLEVYFWAFLFSITTGILSYHQAFNFLDLLLFDAYQKSRVLPVDPELVIVGIDQNSLNTLGKWPWPRSIHASLLKNINTANPKAIGVDIMWSERNLSNPQDDQNLSNQINVTNNLVLPVFNELVSQDGRVVEVIPNAVFISPSTELGHVHAQQSEEDGVIRSVFLKEGVGSAYWPHFSLKLLEQSLKEPLKDLPGEVSQYDLDGHDPWVLVRNHHNYIPFNTNSQRFRIVSYVDVLSGNIPEKTFKDKVVFVGAIAAGMSDQLTTPIGLLKGVEVNAHIYQALRDGNLIQKLPSIEASLLNAGAIFLVVFWITLLSPRLFLLWTVISIALILSVMMVVLWRFNLWLSVSSLLFSVALFYPVWSWLRLERALSFLKEELASYRLNESAEHDNPVQYNLKRFLEFYQSIELISAYRFDLKKPDSEWETVLEYGYVIQPLSLPPKEIWGKESNYYFTQWEANGNEYRIYLVCCDGYTTFDHIADLLLKQLLFSSEKTVKLIKSELIEETITQLSQERRSRKDSQIFMSVSLEGLQDAVIFTNFLGQIEFLNEKARLIFEENELSSDLNIYTLLKKLNLSGSSQWKELLKSLIHENQNFHVECSIEIDRISGTDSIKHEFYLCQGRTLRLEQPSVDALVFTITDISILKKNEQERKEMLHFLGHDLRSPLVSILALIEKNYDSVRVSDRYLLDEIKKYADKNLHYAESYLQLSKAEHVENLDSDYCDMHSVLDTAYSQVVHLAGQKHISLKDIRTEHDAWVLGHGELLERAVINLLTNAIKYSDEYTMISLSLQVVDFKAIIQVSDQGIGISDEHIPNLFKKYYKSGLNKANTTGAGLGLHFVALVCEQHNGTIQVSSKLNHGSTFTISLPIIEMEQADD